VQASKTPKELAAAGWLPTCFAMPPTLRDEDIDTKTFNPPVIQLIQCYTGYVTLVHECSFFPGLLQCMLVREQAFSCGAVPAHKL
jgi:hypothetical protein